MEDEIWDVAVVGAGPAGLAAASRAAAAGARTVVLERGRHPRYKTCGGGLIGVSRAAAAGLGVDLGAVARDTVDAVTFTRDGRSEFTRRAGAPILAMVRRDEFDDALRGLAERAGAVLRQDTAVRGVEQDADAATARLADGSRVRARVLVGADGSAGVTARAVGVACEQVDLGLEVELPVGAQLQQRWRGRVLLDWGPIPGSYGWVFPKGDRLTVGVIAARGQGAATRAYLTAFVERLGLAGIEPVEDSGHLTRCRAPGSPVRSGRLLVAGDAAGLLEPWTREGISFALRSGAAAGDAAAAAATAGDPALLAGYEAELARELLPEMAAGARLLEAFAASPRALHLAFASRPGWRAFARFCAGDLTLARVWRRRPVRLLVAAVAARGRRR
ncbi:geranylgeranyl reductase family protein [Spirilliplanes yamanashiensis]|uniref:Hyaluronate lyase n=1 Tax=Spirilliplanes yamanashiensis TaxID=42233 RepID=A0A8J3Y5F6_9ACTN|nr:geranylgeranyl reductase family protein [Spirilliplanes yamanashiensis]MDP9819358.1 geranylgeranyl reductase family protein [Spirilliplanes yamanashiensis]GIJ01819.1 hyaluronate lyase [Spirilliplanes yamanashiensis]